MKNRLLLLLFCSVFTVSGQEADSAWVLANYNKREVMIAMRDGVRLFTAIYAPKAAGKYPLLMVRTPYSAAPYGEKKFSPRLWTTYWRQYLKANYILVVQDVRGTFMSEGTYEDIRPFNPDKKKKETDEASDPYDAIEWLVKNTASNGKVGVFGVSYPGFYSTMAALSGHPALKAVSPQAPVTDWFMGDDFHHNGAFALNDAFRFYSGFGLPRPKPTTEGRKGFSIPEKDFYEFHLRVGPVSNHSRLLGDSIAFWNELVKHPDFDSWWKVRDTRQAMNNIKPAVLVVGGTFDAEDCYGAWNLYKAIEKQSPSTNNRLVMGPWFHGGWGRSQGTFLGPVRFGMKTSAQYQKKEFSFFEHYLNGAVKDSLAEATIFFSGENQWRNFSAWPPAGMSAQPIFLVADGKLSFEKPSQNNSSSSYVSDPRKPVPFSGLSPLERNREYMIDDQRFASKRPDVLVFTTEELTSDLTLAGPVKANLWISTTGSDADLVVKIIDVFPQDFKYDSAYCCESPQQKEMGGFQMLVRGEIMRGRYRKSFEKPEAFTPNKVEVVNFTLPDVAHTFKKGHRLMVHVQSSWYPLFDMNPQTFTNIYTCSEKDFKAATITVHHSSEGPSSIQLPVLREK
jgi:uncharacterized protein